MSISMFDILGPITVGPSSSHTMGPASAAVRFREAFPQADSFQVTLYGSLAKTGRGHLTDVAVKDALAPYNTCVVFHTEAAELRHPNTMDLEAFRGGERLGGWRVYSVGGGKIEIEGQPSTAPQDVYSLSTFSQIRAYCEERDLRLWQFVEESEGPEIWNYLMDVWKQMKATVYTGLNTEGVLHGGLGVQRKAKFLVRQRHIDQAQSMNLYITNEYTFRRVLDLYLLAWEEGVKTIYYVRSKSLEVEECEVCSS